MMLSVQNKVLSEHRTGDTGKTGDTGETGQVMCDAGDTGLVWLLSVCSRWRDSEIQYK